LFDVGVFGSKERRYACCCCKEWLVLGFVFVLTAGGPHTAL